MKNSFQKKNRCAILVLCGLLAFGCGGGGNGPSGSTLAEAWKKFEAGLYQDAIDAFQSATESLSSVDDLAESYSGLGWSYAFADKLDSAVFAFRSALDKLAIVDAAGGLAAVYLAQDNFEDAVSKSNQALGIDPAWSFDHKPGIDHEDLRLILAQAYFGLGPSSYEDAQAQIDILSPENGLDPNDVESWGDHPTYEAALLESIQVLEETIGAELAI